MGEPVVSARGSAPLKPLAESTKPPFGGLRTCVVSLEPQALLLWGTTL
jgi:hypothetical protein